MWTTLAVIGGLVVIVVLAGTVGGKVAYSAGAAYAKIRPPMPFKPTVETPAVRQARMDYRKAKRALRRGFKN